MYIFIGFGQKKSATRHQPAVWMPVGPLSGNVHFYQLVVGRNLQPDIGLLFECQSARCRVNVHFYRLVVGRNLQPDIGPLSECQTACCRANVGFDQHLVGKLTSDRCRHFCRLADGLKIGLIGIWSACHHWPAEGPVGIPRSDQYRLPPSGWCVLQPTAIIRPTLGRYRHVSWVV